MKLSPPDVKQFMKLTLALQWYAQQQGQILPKVSSFVDYINTSMRQKVEVRNYLFDHLGLIDQFIEANPEDFTKEELAIVANWKNAVCDRFVVERLLKKHAIFIGKQEQVYGVIGIKEELSDMIDKRLLPIYVQAVLLPFKGHIVHDGLLGFFNVSLGGGIRAHYKELYLIAKDNNAIIQTLNSSPTSKLKATNVGEKTTEAQVWTPLLEELANKAKKLRGGGGQPSTYSPIFSLVRASIELAQMATAEEPDFNKIDKKGRRIGTILNQIEDAVDAQ